MSEATGKYKEAAANSKAANQELKQARAIRPRKSAEYNEAVAAAQSAVTAAKSRAAALFMERKPAYTAQQKATEAYRAAEKTTRTKTNELRAALKAYNWAFGRSYGKLNAVDWGVPYPFCTVVDKDDTDASACTRLCTARIDGPVAGIEPVKAGDRCDSINVVPYRLPSTTGWPGLVNPAIPEQCRGTQPDTIVSLHTGVEQAVPAGARVCYALTEGKATDAGSAFTISSDPEGYNCAQWHIDPLHAFELILCLSVVFSYLDCFVR